MSDGETFGCTYIVVGNVRLREWAPDGRPGRQWWLHNTITSGGLAMVRDYLLGPTTGDAPTPPSYIAMGSGTADGMTSVGRFSWFVPGETFRSGIVQRDKGDNQSVIFHVYVNPQDNLNQTVGCYGLIAGPASNQLGTGIILAIAQEMTPYNKNASNSYSLDWTLAVSGKYS